MLDIKFIKNNLELVKQNITKRYSKVNADLIVALYDKKNDIQIQLDGLRQQRNENAKKMKMQLDQNEKNGLIEEGKELKERISILEKKTSEIQSQFFKEFSRIPNLTHPSTPIGATEQESKIIKKIGQTPKFEFKPKDHITLSKELDIIDFEKATMVSGQKFYYLKN